MTDNIQSFNAYIYPYLTRSAVRAKLERMKTAIKTAERTIKYKSPRCINTFTKGTTQNPSDSSMKEIIEHSVNRSLNVPVPERTCRLMRNDTKEKTIKDDDAQIFSAKIKNRVLWSVADLEQFGFTFFEGYRLSKYQFP